MIDKRPALIVRCAGVDDIVGCIDFARSHYLLVAIRGGGHNVAGNAVCDGGIVIDLSRMKSVRVHPATRTALAEAGTTLGEFDRQTQAFGLATTGGIVSTTGIAGLTLGGGIGWLMGKFGLACDNLLSVDIVTADGRLLKSSATENPDLFWGVRGGGGNFGVVTSFEYRLHPVGPVLGGAVQHPLKKAKEALKFFRDFTSTTPDELTLQAGFSTGADGEPVFGISVCYTGSIEEGEKILRPLRAFGPPQANRIRPMAYTERQQLSDAKFPAGFQNYWKSNFLRILSDDAIEIMTDQFATVPSKDAVVFMEHMGGKVRRINPDETAFNYRDVSYNFTILGIWPDPSERERNIQWVRELWQAMQPFSSGGVYVNYLGQETEEGHKRVRAAYGPSKYQRLAALKNKYDPTNLFRLNQNIRPTV